jgi:hypothetical protein
LPPFLNRILSVQSTIHRVSEGFIFMISGYSHHYIIKTFFPIKLG